MTCRDCLTNSASYNMSCKGCCDRWDKRIKDEQHKKMLAEAMKEKFKEITR